MLRGGGTRMISARMLLFRRPLSAGGAVVFRAQMMWGDMDAYQRYAALHSPEASRSDQIILEACATIQVWLASVTIFLSQAPQQLPVFPALRGRSSISPGGKRRRTDDIKDARRVRASNTSPQCALARISSTRASTPTDSWAERAASRHV